MRRPLETARRVRRVAVHDDPCLGDAQYAGVEVDAPPPKSSELTAAQPACEQERPPRGEPVVAGRLEERTGMLGRPGMHRLGLHSRPGHSDERIATDEAGHVRPLRRGLERRSPLAAASRVRGSRSPASSTLVAPSRSRAPAIASGAAGDASRSTSPSSRAPSRSATKEGSSGSTLRHDRSKEHGAFA